MNKVRSLKRLCYMITISLLTSMLLPIISYAASTVQFTYDSSTGKLSGSVYVQDPNKVQVSVQNAVYELTSIPLKEMASQYITYDDNNAPLKLARYELNVGVNNAPSKIIMNACGQSVEVVQYGGFNNYKFYASSDSWRLGPYRTTGHQFFTVHPEAAYIMAGDKLVDFVAADNDSDTISVDLPYGGGSSSVLKAVYASDFTLWDDTVSQSVYLNKAEKKSDYFIVQAGAKLTAGHQYTLKLSVTADGDEIKLPTTKGLYSARVSVGYIDSDNFMVTKSRVYFDKLNIGVVTPDGTPGSKGAGAPFADMSSCSGSGNGNGTENENGNSNGNGNGGGVSPGTAPSGDPSIKETDQGVQLGGGAVTVTEATESNGQLVAKVVLTGDKLGQALDLLKNKAEANQIVAIDISGTKAATAQVEFPAGILSGAATKTPNAVLSIQGSHVGYELPLSVLNLQSIVQTLGVPIEQVKVIVTMEQVIGSPAAPIANQATSSGMTLVGDPYEFSIRVEAGGKSVLVNDFGNTFVTRTITLPGIFDVSQLAGVRYDSETKTFYPVPTIFSTVNGQTQASMVRNGNSMYAVVTHQKSFEDLAKHWSKQDVEWLASKMIVQGMTDSSFMPDDSITRVQIASLLVRAFGLTEDRKASSFTDVSANDWFAGAVGAAVKAGLVSGFEDQTFRPNAVLTREQMAVMASRALAFAGKEASSNGSAGALAAYGDAGSVSDWAKSAFAQLVQAGIMQGTADTELAPAKTATRAQAAVVVKGLLQAAGYVNK